MCKQVCISRTCEQNVYKQRTCNVSGHMWVEMHVGGACVSRVHVSEASASGAYVDDGAGGVYVSRARVGCEQGGVRGQWDREAAGSKR